MQARPLGLVSSSAVAAFAIALSLAPFATRSTAGEPQSAPAAAPTIFKWVDENGIAHYTTDRERIPSEIRERVESRPVAATTNPQAAAQAAHDDVMRDAVHTKPAVGTSTAPLATPTAAATAAAAVPAPNPSAAPVASTPVAPAPAPAAAVIAMPTPAPGTETEEKRGAVEETVIQEAPAAETTIVEAPAPTPPPTPAQVAAPAPLAEDMQDEASAVSAPPPAPEAPIDPKEQAQISELDQKIEAVEGEISQREETLAALISTPDDQRTTPLVDDPQFREISQTLPKLQADLQTLRERRNKIQPTTATP